MSDEFIGRGWAFPLRTDATGGIALVSREREIEEAIRLILGTSPGERPMRPEFGCRIHEYVFASADGGTASAIAAEVKAALRRWEPRDRRRGRRGQLRRPGRQRALHRHPLRHPADQRPPQPRVPVLRDPGRRLTMALPVPNLDDRRFQDLVDEAKRLVQQRCPEWTDHNVSDPGVTLIELFAWMTDQLVYRLNRVPDRNYVKFLELIGVSLYPPTAARTPVTFWLSAPQPDVVTIAAGHAGRDAAHRHRRGDRVRHDRGPADRPVARSRRLGSMIDGKTLRDHGESLEKGTDIFRFQEVPPARRRALRRPVRGGAVERGPAALQGVDIDGVGVDPTNPPLAWEAWTGDDWEPCELDSDTTGGLNRDGDVVLHVPRGHVASLIAKQRGRLAARPGHGARPRASPRTAPRPTVERPHRDHHRRHGGRGQRRAGARARRSGISEGVPGQRFALKRGPVVPGDDDPVLEVTGDEGWDEWTHVPGLRGERPGRPPLHARHSRRARSGSGPAVRLADGALRRYGAVPPKGAHLRLREYRVGGGRRGNVAPRAITVLKSSIPFVSRVENRRPARGGVDGEDIENAKVRGPIRLRARGRAVTTEDYEQLAREAAPEVARVRAVAAGDGADAGSVRVLIVPSAVVRAGPAPVRPAGAQPGHAPEGHRPPRGVPGHRHAGDRGAARSTAGITVVAKLRARPRVNPTPPPGGGAAGAVRVLPPDHRRPRRDRLAVRAPDQRRRGLLRPPGPPRAPSSVEDARLFGADPVTGQRGQQTQRLELEPHALVFSYEHQVLVEGA